MAWHGPRLSPRSCLAPLVSALPVMPDQPPGGRTIERCLERLSEAVAKLGPQAEQLAPGPPWPAVRGFGNALRHAYDRVDPGRIWEVGPAESWAIARFRAILKAEIIQ